MTVHKVPALTVKLGTVLDAVIEERGNRHTVYRWKGMQLLTDANAMEKGRPKLYLVRGKLQATRKLRADADAGAASDTYGEWHKRPHDLVGELDTRPCGHRLGRMVLIGYRSDKWGRKGETHDYSHDFFEENGVPPLVYADARTLDSARCVVVVGGSMKVTDRGIA